MVTMNAARNLVLTFFPLAIGVPLGLAGCGTTTTERTASGALLGTAGGALIGSASGNAGKGALIGAGVGAVGGYLYDREQKRENDRGYYH
jgi:hypothetical protein